MPAIGANIRRAREALGWSQEELAQKMGYKSRTSIHKIEAGKSDIPQSKIAEFAHVLGLTPAVLLGLVDEESSITTDSIAKVVVRMRSDKSFYNAVLSLYELEGERLQKAGIALTLL